MNVEAVDASGQGFEIGGEQKAVGCFADSDLTDSLGRAVGADQINGDVNRRRVCAEGEGA